MKTFNFKGFEFRVIERDGDPWFVAKDVCNVLGTRTKDIPSILDDDERKTLSSAAFMQVGGGVVDSTDPLWGQPVVIINEPGLYSLILRSRKARAREFKRWVTHEVLPAIRQSEAYVSPGSDLASALAGGDTEAALAIVKKAVEIAETERAKRLEAEPRTLSATGAEKRTGGEPVWNLKDALANTLGVDTRGIYPTLRVLGVVEKRSSGGYLVRRPWDDVLFDSENEVDGKVYKTGVPRVRPGKQSEFLERVKRAYSAHIGIG